MPAECSGCLELSGHQGGVARGVEKVVETGKQFVSTGCVQVESATDPRAQRQQVGVTETLWKALVTREDDAEKGM